jgi:hypothetical protein
MSGKGWASHAAGVGKLAVQQYVELAKIRSTRGRRGGENTKMGEEYRSEKEEKRELIMKMKTMRNTVMEKVEVEVEVEVVDEGRET